MATTARHDRADWDSQWLDWEIDEPAGEAQFQQWLRDDYVPLAGGWHY